MCTWQMPVSKTYEIIIDCRDEFHHESSSGKNFKRKLMLTAKSKDTLEN